MSINEYASNIIRQLDEELNTTVSVALFGQPGSGKSSLINKIIGVDKAKVGVETDKTVEAASYEAKGLRFVDLPGYDTKEFPKDTFFEKQKIKEFDLFLCVTSGKLHQADTEFFQALAKLGKVCVFVINKSDEIWEDGVKYEELQKRKIEDITKHVGRAVKIIFTSCRANTGLDVLEDEISNNLNDAKRERWFRGAQAYSIKFLQEKRSASEKHVSIKAAAAAAIALNPIPTFTPIPGLPTFIPIPGLDVSVDLSILLALFKDIRDDFGLTDDSLAGLKESSIPFVASLANNVYKYASNEGVLILLKSVSGREAVKSFAKYVPFIGEAIAASLGYAITSNAGKSYLDDCYKLAEVVLKDKFNC